MLSKHIEIIPHVDRSKNARDLGVSARYKGKECRVVDYEGPLAQRSNGLNLILHDLEDCLKFARYPEPKSPVLQSALHRALVITYGKCFANADHRKVQLNAKDIFKGCSENTWRHHQSLITMRNEFVAPSASVDYEESSAKIILPPEDPPELDSRLS